MSVRHHHGGGDPAFDALVAVLFIGVIVAAVSTVVRMTILAGLHSDQGGRHAALVSR